MAVALLLARDPLPESRAEVNDSRVIPVTLDDARLLLANVTDPELSNWLALQIVLCERELPVVNA